MHEELLADVLCETAEQMFFQEFESDPGRQPPQDVFWASIDVSSPQYFRLIVAAAEGEIKEALEMVFMGEREVTDERVGDVVAELANTIAGSLSRRLSDDTLLELSTPTKGHGYAPPTSEYHAFSSDELTFFVTVSRDTSPLEEEE